jgi:hypothetical protein
MVDFHSKRADIAEAKNRKLLRALDKAEIALNLAAKCLPHNDIFVALAAILPFKDDIKREMEV